MRKCGTVACLSAVLLLTAVGTGWGALKALTGNVDNSAGVWHTNTCGGSRCVVQANGDVRFTLETNIRCGATRHLELRLLFTDHKTVSKKAVVASCAKLPNTVVVATNVLATTKIQLQAMSDVGIPTFGDTKFSGSIGNVK